MNPRRVNLISAVARLMRSPMTVLVFGLAGVICGACAPPLIDATSIIGELYLAFLGLIAVPFLFSSLSSSLASMLQSTSDKSIKLSLPKVALVMYLALVTTGVIFFMVGKGFTKLCPDAIKVERLDEMFQKDSIGLDKVVVTYFRTTQAVEVPQKEARGQFSFREFLQQSVPKNIFLSLVENNVLHILVFTIFFGIALGVMPASRTQSTISLLNVIYHVCMEFVSWSAYLMPFIVFSLLGRMVAVLDMEILVISSGVLGVFILVSLVLTVCAWCVWSRSVGCSLRQLLHDEGRVLLFGFCAGQRLAILPMLLQDMEQKQRLPEKGLKILMPFSFTLGTFSSLSLYVFLIVFTAHLYGISLPLSVVVPLCLLTPIIMYCGTFPFPIAIMAKFLNMPDELALLLLVGTISITNPFATLWNSSMGCAFTAWCLRKRRNQLL